MTEMDKTVGSRFSPGELGVGHMKYERLIRNQNSHRIECKLCNLHNIIKYKKKIPIKEAHKNHTLCNNCKAKWMTRRWVVGG